MMNKWFTEVAELADRFDEVCERFYDENKPDIQFWAASALFDRTRDVIRELLDELRMGS